MPGNIIAVDGFSSTGKSTLASKLAKHYNFYYLNSGLMYRIISYFALNNGCIIKDKIKESQLINKLDNDIEEFTPEQSIPNWYDLGDFNIEYVQINNEKGEEVYKDDDFSSDLKKIDKNKKF